jgi:hypothetical protein
MHEPIWVEVTLVGIGLADAHPGNQAQVGLDDEERLLVPQARHWELQKIEWKTASHRTSSIHTKRQVYFGCRYGGDMQQFYVIFYANYWQVRER